MTARFQINRGEGSSRLKFTGMLPSTHEPSVAPRGLHQASRPADEDSWSRLGTPGRGLEKLKKNIMVFCLVVRICVHGGKHGKW